MNLFNSTAVTFDFDHPSHQIVESSPESYIILQRKILSSARTKDGSMNPEAFAPFANVPTSTSSKPKRIKFLFYNEGLLTDWQCRTVVEMTFTSPFEKVLDSYFGIISFTLSASRLSVIQFNNKSFLFPRIPILLFACRLTSPSSSGSSTPILFLNPEILHGYLDIFFEASGSPPQITEIPTTVQPRFTQFYSLPLQRVSPSNFDQVLSGGTLAIECRKNDQLEFIVKKETFSFQDRERTRYVMTIRNLTFSGLDSHKAFRYVLHSVPYSSFLSTSPYRMTYTPNIATNISTSSTFPENYVDRVGVFDIGLVNVNNSNQTFSVDPAFSEFSIDVARLSSSAVAIISDSIGLGAGTVGADEHRSFVSELKRTTTYPIYNVSKHRLHFLDVLGSLESLKLISPSTVVLALGTDTVGRAFFRPSEMIFRHPSNNRLSLRFDDTDYNIPAGNQPKYDTIIGRTYVRYDAQSSVYTSRQSEYEMDSVSQTEQYAALFRQTYQALKSIGVSEIIVVGLPPISGGTSAFYEERLFTDTSLLTANGHTNFYLNSAALLSRVVHVKPSLLNFSNFINQSANTFDFFINLRAELGNATQLSQRFIVVLPGGTPDSNSVYFNVQGHVLLAELVSRLLSNINTSLLFTQNQRQFDVRLGLTKYLNAQKIYALDQTHNFPVLYDAKIDINVYTTTFENLHSPFQGYREIKIGTHDLYDYVMIVPFLGILGLMLVDPNDVRREISLLPNRPTVIFTRFKRLFVRNDAQKEIPVSIILGKMK